MQTIAVKSDYPRKSFFETFMIEDGERIAQMVIARHEQAVWQEVDVLDETERARWFRTYGRVVDGV